MSNIAASQNPFDDFFVDPVYLKFKQFLWNYQIRRRHILDELRATHAPAVLEVGAGVAPMVPPSPGAVYTDISENAIAFLKEKLAGYNCKVMPAEQIPFDDHSFDAVVSSEVLEHITDDAVAIAEMVRVLKPGGSLILTVPTHQFFFSIDDRFVGHERRYNPAALVQLLEINGLSQIRIVKVAGLLDKIAYILVVAIFKLVAVFTPDKSTKQRSILRVIMTLIFPIYWFLNLIYTFLVYLESRVIPLALTTVILVHAKKI